jgi:hypothetical protein
MLRILFLVLGTTVSAIAVAHPGSHPEGAVATAAVHLLVAFGYLPVIICAGVWAGRAWLRSSRTARAGARAAG